MLSIAAATTEDIPFIIRGIVASDTVPHGDGSTVYERVYGFTRAELEGFLEFALKANLPGNQLTLSEFVVLKEEGAPIGCCVGWIEGVTATPSGKAIAMLVSRFLGHRRVIDRTPQVRGLISCHPGRTAGALQLESFFVHPSARRQGHTYRLINHCLDNKSDGVGWSEIVLLSDNRPARKAYERAGFTLVPGINPNCADFQNYTGSDGFCRLRRSIPNHLSINQARTI